MATQGRDGSPPNSSGRRTNQGPGILVGAGVTVLFSALATAGVKLPHTLILVISVCGVTMVAAGIIIIVAPLVPWRTVLHWINRGADYVVKRLVEKGRTQATSEAFATAGGLLGELLARVECY